MQDTLEPALAQIAGASVATTCAGRTDRGVHAHGQVVHFDTAAERPVSAWVRGVNTHLPDSVAVLWAHVQDDAPTVTSRAPQLPAGLDDVLAQGLAKDPAERYGSCWSLVRAARDTLAPYWQSRRD